MHVRITRGISDTARYDEFVALGKEIAEAVKRVPGCRSYTGGADRATGAIIGISRWDSAEAAAFSRDQLGDIVPRLQALGVRLEAPEIYEVLVES